MALRDVQVLGVEYAVAATLGRRGGDGYRTLRVTAAVAASAAAAGSLRLAAKQRVSTPNAWHDDQFHLRSPPAVVKKLILVSGIPKQQPIAASGFAVCCGWLATRSSETA